MRWQGRAGAALAPWAWPVLLPACSGRSRPSSGRPRPPLRRRQTRGSRTRCASSGMRSRSGRGSQVRSTLGPLRAASGACARATRAGQLRVVADALPAPDAVDPAVAPHHRRLRVLAAEAEARLDRSLGAVDALTARVHLARFTEEEADGLAAQLERLAQAVDSAGEVSGL